MTYISDEITSALARHFKCTGLFNIDVATRERVAEHLSDIVNELGPVQSYARDATEAYLEILMCLRRDGIVTIPNFVSKSDIAKINEYFVSCRGYQAHVPFYAKSSELITKEEARAASLPVLSFSPEVSLACPELFNVIINRSLIDIAASYLRCFPTLYSVNSYYSHPSPIHYPGQDDHRDDDCFKFLAAFIYLSDVDLESGPFTYYLGTHRKNRSDLAPGLAPAAVCGSAGTLILVDSWGIHRGQPPLTKHRLVSWWRYGMGLAGGYFQDENWRYKTSEAKLWDKICKQPDLQYFLRGFLSSPHHVT